jgi:predicted N-acyltransferase
MRLRLLDRVEAVAAAEWDACFPADYPFVRHAFLSALERQACAVPDTGWTPCHAVLEDEGGQVCAAAPLYAKDHSYGEFVFDFSWAETSRRIGQPYYPKLLCAVPFTPCSGPRIGGLSASSRAQLARSLPQLAAQLGLSSFHALFLQSADQALLEQAACIERRDVQFHWYNRGYADFAAFLATLASDKRKKILRERRRVAEAGLRFECEPGDALNEAAWREVYALYGNTYEERGQAPYLSLEFFLDYARRPGTPVRLVSAFEARRRVAVAITLVGGDTLYGRHWGAAEHYHSLHFETCYYQGIELCIRERLAHFDAGAQGEHKLARGFVPVQTVSMHRLVERRLHQAVAEAMQREREWVGQRDAALQAHVPFKQSASADDRGDG